MAAGADEEKAENARLSCFVGAIAIGDLVKSTLGPKGMDKIMVRPARRVQREALLLPPNASFCVLHFAAHNHGHSLFLSQRFVPYFCAMFHVPWCELYPWCDARCP